MFAKVFFTLRNRKEFALVLDGVLGHHIVVARVVFTPVPECPELIVSLLDGFIIDAPSHEVGAAMALEGKFISTFLAYSLTEGLIVEP